MTLIEYLETWRGTFAGSPLGFGPWAFMEALPLLESVGYSVARKMEVTEPIRLILHAHFAALVAQRWENILQNFVLRKWLDERMVYDLRIALAAHIRMDYGDTLKEVVADASSGRTHKLLGLFWDELMALPVPTEGEADE